MKSLFLYIIIIILFLTPVLIAAPGGGGNNGYRHLSALVTVEYPGGSPAAGVEVKMIAMMYGSEGDGSQIIYGNTTSGGWVNLSVDVYYEGWEEGHFISVSISDDDYTVLSSSNTSSSVSYTIYPDFEVIYDRDKDYITDNLETIISEKFKPVLHKHSLDHQEGVANFDEVLNSYMTLTAFNDFGQRAINDRDVPPIHYWEGTGDECSFGQGDHSTHWRLVLNSPIGWAGASPGNRPLYFHVSKQGSYFYVQYWYFFAMNDLTTQTRNQTWHEGDWEHVSIKLQEVNCDPAYSDWEVLPGVYVKYNPIAVNFYTHYGGKTSLANDCWWSSSNASTYSGLQQGYSDSRTHLHIWIAANGHASYNRYELVYSMYVDKWIGGYHLFDAYEDNVDYDPSGYDLYFPYDYLDKLGSVILETWCQRHGWTWPYHYDPVGNSKEWLAFVGRMGNYWANSFTNTPSPKSPRMNSEWVGFTEDYSNSGFGNEEGGFFFLINHSIDWIVDNPNGD